MDTRDKSVTAIKMFEGMGMWFVRDDNVWTYSIEVDHSLVSDRLARLG